MGSEYKKGHTIRFFGN